MRAHVCSGSRFLQASAAGVLRVSHTETQQAEKTSQTQKSLENWGNDTEGPSASLPEADWAELMFKWNLMKLASIY